jgi:hypothetical protein
LAAAVARHPQPAVVVVVYDARREHLVQAVPLVLVAAAHVEHLNELRLNLPAGGVP